MRMVLTTLPEPGAGNPPGVAFRRATRQQSATGPEAR